MFTSLGPYRLGFLSDTSGIGHWASGIGSGHRVRASGIGHRHRASSAGIGIGIGHRHRASASGIGIGHRASGIGHRHRHRPSTSASGIGHRHRASASHRVGSVSSNRSKSSRSRSEKRCVRTQVRTTASFTVVCDCHHYTVVCNAITPSCFVVSSICDWTWRPPSGGATRPTNAHVRAMGHD